MARIGAQETVRVAAVAPATAKRPTCTPGTSWPRHAHRPEARGISTVPCPQTCSPEARDAVQLRWLHPGTRPGPRCAAQCWDTNPGQPRACVTREGLAAAGAWPGVPQQAFRGDEPDADSGGPRPSHQEQMT